MALLRVTFGIALLLVLSFGPAAAQTGSVNLRAAMQLQFDCENPWKVKNYGVRATLTGVLNADKSATADLAINGFFLNTTVHFDTRLGRGSMAAPGGTSQLRVLGSNKLRGVWSLPNNDLILDLTMAGQSCQSHLTLRLKPGKKEYSMYGGTKFYYCSAARVISTSCTAK